MCIGWPMQVTEHWPGSAHAQRRDVLARIDTRLVGEVAVGDWLLVFQGAARERLAAGRAAEIDAALALLEAAMGGDGEGAAGDPGFALPSAMDPALLAALSGPAPKGNPR